MEKIVISDRWRQSLVISTDIHFKMIGPAIEEEEEKKHTLVMEANDVNDDDGDESEVFYSSNEEAKEDQKEEEEILPKKVQRKTRNVGAREIDIMTPNFKQITHTKGAKIDFDF